MHNIPPAQNILIVDEHDNCIGEEDKERCHDGDGILHRGFLAMLFTDRGELVLARRSARKRLWPGFWDGTVASHVLREEDYLLASRRRLIEETGLVADSIRYLFKFRYKAGYRDAGTEHEICAVTLVTGIDEEQLLPDGSEIAELRTIDPRSIVIDHASEEYTPWLILALDHMRQQRQVWPVAAP